MYMLRWGIFYNYYILHVVYRCLTTVRSTECDGHMRRDVIGDILFGTCWHNDWHEENIGVKQNTTIQPSTDDTLRLVLYTVFCEFMFEPMSYFCAGRSACIIVLCWIALHQD